MTRICLKSELSHFSVFAYSYSSSNLEKRLADFKKKEKPDSYIPPPTLSDRRNLHVCLWRLPHSLYIAIIVVLTVFQGSHTLQACYHFVESKVFPTATSITQQNLQNAKADQNRINSRKHHQQSRK